jgi:VanZ family protein
MDDARRRHVWTIGWGLLILGLLLAPSSIVPAGPSAPLPAGSDKLVHAGLFLVFALLLRRSLAMLPGVRRPWLLAFALTAAYGGLTELLQLGLTSDRDAELADVVADVVGAALAGLWRG